MNNDEVNVFRRLLLLCFYCLLMANEYRKHAFIANMTIIFCLCIFIENICIGILLAEFEPIN